MNILKTIFNFFKKLFPAPKEYNNNNPSQEYLFIGGAHDGIKMFIPDEESVVKLPIDRTSDILLIDNSQFYFPFEIYRKIALCAPKSLTYIFIHEKLNDTDILDILINNYKPAHEKT